MKSGVLDYLYIMFWRFRHFEQTRNKSWINGHYSLVIIRTIQTHFGILVENFCSWSKYTKTKMTLLRDLFSKCPNKINLVQIVLSNEQCQFTSHTNKVHRWTVPHHLATAVIVLNAYCRLIETMHWSVTVYDGKHHSISLTLSTITRIATDSNHESASLITSSSLTLSQLFLRFSNRDQWSNLFVKTVHAQT